MSYCKILICFFILLSILSNSFSQKIKNCYVLALEGGGDKGAYQGGVIKGLIDSLPSNETRYDVVTGISVGSINAAAMSVFAKGQEKEAADFVLNTWRDIKSSKTVFQNYWLGPLYGLFFKSGFYDTSPLVKFLTKAVNDKKILRKIIVGSTNIENGTYITWDEIDFEGEVTKLIEAVLASAAFPVIFPIREVNNVSYVDGGVKNSIDISSGINKCLDMGFKPENIVVDAILCSAANELENIDPKKLHPTQILIRINEIFGYDSSMRDTENVPLNFPKVNFRYLISPTKKLPYSVLPLAFSPKDIETMIEIGIQDGIDAVKKHEKEGNAMKTINEFREKRIKEHRERGRRNKNKVSSLTKGEQLKLLK